MREIEDAIDELAAELWRLMDHELEGIQRSPEDLGRGGVWIAERAKGGKRREQRRGRGGERL